MLARFDLAGSQAARRRPSLSSVQANNKGAASEESLGSQLLSAVLSDDLEGANTIFASVSSSHARKVAPARYEATLAAPELAMRLRTSSGAAVAPSAPAAPAPAKSAAPSRSVAEACAPSEDAHPGI